MQDLDGESTDETEEESSNVIESSPLAFHNRKKTKQKSIDINSIAVEDFKHILSMHKINDKENDEESDINVTGSNDSNSTCSFNDSTYKEFKKLIEAKLAAYEGRKFTGDNAENASY